MKNCKYQKQIFSELEKSPGQSEQNLPPKSLQHLRQCVSCQEFLNSYQHITRILKNDRTYSQPAKFIFVTTATKKFPLWFPYKAIVSMAIVLILIITATSLFYPKPEPAKVTFQVNLPMASSVAVVGDFNNWDIQKGQLFPAKKYWSRTFFIQPGRYQYIVVVDGKKILPVNSGPSSVPDGFGSQNAVLNTKQNRVVLKI